VANDYRFKERVESDFTLHANEFCRLSDLNDAMPLALRTFPRGDAAARRPCREQNRQNYLAKSVKTVIVIGTVGL
jgi:hypothetical protein